MAEVNNVQQCGVRNVFKFDLKLRPQGWEQTSALWSEKPHNDGKGSQQENMFILQNPSHHNNETKCP